MNDQTRAFLRHTFQGTRGWFEITYIYSAEKRPVLTRAYPMEKAIIDWDEVERANQAGYSIYYGMTTNKRAVSLHQRRRKYDAWDMPCLWAEFDYKDGVYQGQDAVLDVLYNHDTILPPTAVIASGGGIHAIWRVEPVEITKENRPIAEQILRGMAVFLKSDTSVAEVARILRMPGTINTKPERNGARCEIIDLLPGEYAIEDFLSYADYAAPKQRPLERDLPRYRPNNLPGFVQTYLDTPIGDGQRNVELNKAAYVLHTEGYNQSEAERILMSKAELDGLGESEILRTIRSAYSAAPGTPNYVSSKMLTRMRAGDRLRKRLE